MFADFHGMTEFRGWRLRQLGSFWLESRFETFEGDIQVHDELFIISDHFRQMTMGLSLTFDLHETSWHNTMTIIWMRILFTRFRLSFGNSFLSQASWRVTRHTSRVGRGDCYVLDPTRVVMTSDRRDLISLACRMPSSCLVGSWLAVRKVCTNFVVEYLSFVCKYLIIRWVGFSAVLMCLLSFPELQTQNNNNTQNKLNQLKSDGYCQHFYFLVFHTPLTNNLFTLKFQ